jgi:hypothetical protein
MTSGTGRPRVIRQTAASIDRRIGTPALFDLDGDDVTPRRLALEAVERRANGFLRLRYRIQETTP